MQLGRKRKSVLEPTRVNLLSLIIDFYSFLLRNSIWQIIILQKYHWDLKIFALWHNRTDYLLMEITLIFKEKIKHTLKK